MNQHHEEHKHSNISYIGVLAIFLTLGFVAIYCFLENKFKNNVPLIAKEVVIHDTLNLDTFSVDNLNMLMNILEIEEPNIVFNQCILETGTYTSPAFRNHNNLFGFMKGKEIRHYDNWRESLIHYSHWQNINYKGGDYYKFLKEIGYAEDSLYIYKLKQLEKCQK